MRGKINFVLLIAVGLLNLAPVIGVTSADLLNRLYGIELESPDLLTLMRHRAVLFGLLGGFILFAAFRTSLQLLAAIAALVAMSSFVVLAYISGEVGAELQRVVIADVFGCIAIALVLVTNVRNLRDAA